MSQGNHKNFLKRLFSSKIFLAAAVLILVFLTVNVSKESYRKYQLNEEIDSLKSEVEQLTGKNHQLADLIKSFSQDSYLEKEARVKLNLKKPGEKLVILPKEESLNNQESLTNDEKDKKSGGIPNYWKWWEHFFK